MIDGVYKHRYTDIKLCIYYFEMAFKHKDLTTMVYLREQLSVLIENNETISTCEYVRALDLIYHTYDFQGKFKTAIEILDRINSLVPSLPDDYDLEKFRKLIHNQRDQTSEDTEDYNIRGGAIPMLDFTQMEKINISKLIMKEGSSSRHDCSLMSDKSPERKSKTARENFLGNAHRNLFDYDQSADNLLRITEKTNEDEKELPLLTPKEHNETANLLDLSNPDLSIDVTEKEFMENDVNPSKNITFRSFSDPKYFLEKGKLCCRIVLDYHAKINLQKENEESKYPDLISFEDTRDDRAMQALTSRDYNELLEEGLGSLVEFLLNLFYRKQYYSEEGFESKKEKAFFWVSVVLCKLKRHEESLDIIKRYSHKWNHSEKFIDSIISEMMEADPHLREKYHF